MESRVFKNSYDVSLMWSLLSGARIWPGVQAMLRQHIRSTGYSKPESVTRDAPAVFPDQRVRDGELERFRKRVWVEPQGPTILPDGLKLRTLELEAVPVPWVVVPTWLVQANEERHIIAQPQQAEIVLQVAQLLPGH